jgi:hypothetical protein
MCSSHLKVEEEVEVDLVVALVAALEVVPRLLLVQAALPQRNQLLLQQRPHRKVQKPTQLLRLPHPRQNRATPKAHMLTMEQ